MSRQTSNEPIRTPWGSESDDKYDRLKMAYMRSMAANGFYKRNLARLALAYWLRPTRP